MSAPSPRPRAVNAAFWCWVVAALLLMVGGLIAASASLPALFRGAGVISAIAGAGMAFLAGRSRAGDARFRRAGIALSLAIVVLVAVVAALGVVPRPDADLGDPAGRRYRPDHAACCRSVLRGEVVTQEGAVSNVLFYEPGASWLWVLTGPASGIAMLLIQVSAGLGIQWIVPTIFFALVTSFVAVQVKAARIHTSVELTPTTLREGTEVTEYRRHRADLSGGVGSRCAPMAVRPRAGRAHGRAEGSDGHRREADQ